jgi:CRP-like cAMP-binding protein
MTFWPDQLMGQDSKQALIARIPLFASLDVASKMRISQLLRTRECRAREAVVWEGETGGSLFLIVSGYFKALTTGVGGKELVFSVMGPGEVFGELSVLDGQPRSATIVALQSGELAVLERDALLALLHSSSAVAIELLLEVCQRLRHLSRRCENLSSLAVPARLAEVLVALADRHGHSRGACIQIPVRLSQQELANMVGASRETINKQLKSWSEVGIIRRESGCIVISNLTALRQAVEA